MDHQPLNEPPGGCVWLVSVPASLPGLGFGLFSGAVWARTVGVIVATVSAIVNFAFMPYYPLWSLTIIAIDVFVIRALTAHGRDIVKENDRAPRV